MAGLSHLKLGIFAVGWYFITFYLCIHVNASAEKISEEGLTHFLRINEQLIRLKELDTQGHGLQHKDVQYTMHTIQQLLTFQPSHETFWDLSKLDNFDKTYQETQTNAKDTSTDTYCVYTQDTIDGYPRLTRPDEKQPKLRNLTGILPNQCTAYHYTEGCCHPIQAQALGKNAETITGTFGLSKFGGCPACADNIIRFWCDVTCNPKQSGIVHFTGFRNISGHINVLSANVTGYREYLCGVWDSCSKTSLVQLLQLPSCEAFFNLQVKQHGLDAGVYFNLDYLDTPPKNSLLIEQPLQYCCSYYNDLENPNMGNDSCPCTACKDSCSITCPGATGKAGPKQSTTFEIKYGVMYGFDTWTVVGLYIGLFVFSIVVFWFSRRAQRKRLLESP